MDKKENQQDNIIDIPIQFGDEPVENVPAQEIKESKSTMEQDNSQENQIESNEETTDFTSENKKENTDINENGKALDQKKENGIISDVKDSHSQEDSGITPNDSQPQEVDTTKQAIQYQQRINELRHHLEQLQNTFEKYKEKLNILKKEEENSQKRAKKDIENARFSIRNQVLHDFLPIVDHLEMALQHSKQTNALIEGISMVIKQFSSVLEKYGVSIEKKEQHIEIKDKKENNGIGHDEVKHDE